MPALLTACCVLCADHLVKRLRNALYGTNQPSKRAGKQFLREIRFPGLDFFASWLALEELFNLDCENEVSPVLTHVYAALTCTTVVFVFRCVYSTV